MAPIKTVSTIMQNTVEWINLLPGVKAASTKLAVKRHAFILPAALVPNIIKPMCTKDDRWISFSTSSPGTRRAQPINVSTC